MKKLTPSQAASCAIIALGAVVVIVLAIAAMTNRFGVTWGDVVGAIAALSAIIRTARNRSIDPAKDGKTDGTPLADVEPLFRTMLSVSVSAFNTAKSTTTNDNALKMGLAAAQDFIQAAAPDVTIKAPAILAGAMNMPLAESIPVLLSSIPAAAPVVAKAEQVAQQAEVIEAKAAPIAAVVVPIVQEAASYLPPDKVQEVQKALGEATGAFQRLGGVLVAIGGMTGPASSQDKPTSPPDSAIQGTAGAGAEVVALTPDSLPLATDTGVQGTEGD